MARSVQRVVETFDTVMRWSGPLLPMIAIALIPASHPPPFLAIVPLNSQRLTVDGYEANKSETDPPQLSWFLICFRVFVKTKDTDQDAMGGRCIEDVSTTTSPMMSEVQPTCL